MPSTSREIAVSVNSHQFRISHLLLATFLFALTFAAAPILELHETEWGLWCVVASSGLTARYVGWLCGTPLGFAVRHSVAWFFGIIGCALAIIAINFRSCPSIGQLMRDLPDGLAVAALVYGMLVATLLECVFVLATFSRRSTGFVFVVVPNRSQQQESATTDKTKDN